MVQRVKTEMTEKARKNRAARAGSADFDVGSIHRKPGVRWKSEIVDTRHERVY